MNLPFIMVAPNGAYKQKTDHTNLPVSISEIIQTAVECQGAGANGIHVHVRDQNGQHCLDAGLYKEVICELDHVTPTLLVQITTEAVGMYTPKQQQDLVRNVKPKAVSVALKEIFGDADQKAAAIFYHWVSDHHIDLQHILYSTEDILRLHHLIELGSIPPSLTSCLYVLGRYTSNQQSSTNDLASFMRIRGQCTSLKDSRFMVCAFGVEETNCLVDAASQGGHCRIGFENNLLHCDGSVATNNAERVTELVSRLNSL